MIQLSEFQLFSQTTASSNNLSVLDHGISLYYVSQNWEEIKIEEETEEGKKVDSIIRVPAQVIGHFRVALNLIMKPRLRVKKTFALSLAFVTRFKATRQWSSNSPSSIY